MAPAADRSLCNQAGASFLRKVGICEAVRKAGTASAECGAKLRNIYGKLVIFLFAGHLSPYGCRPTGFYSLTADFTDRTDGVSPTAGLRIGRIGVSPTADFTDRMDGGFSDRGFYG